MGAAAGGTVAVSPPMNLMSSGCTPSRSAITCAKVVSWPWPVDCVPTASSTVPRALHRDLDALVRDADRRLDIVGNADAAQLAALLRFAATRGKALPVGALQHALHVAGEIAAVVEQPARGAVGQLLARDEVLLPDPHAVHAEPMRGEIDQPLQHQRRLRPAGAAERRGRHRVGHHRAAAHVHQRDVVDRGGDAIGVAERHVGHGLPADAADVVDMVGGDAAVAREREPRGGDEIAALRSR